MQFRGANSRKLPPQKEEGEARSQKMPFGAKGISGTLGEPGVFHWGLQASEL